MSNHETLSNVIYFLDSVLPEACSSPKWTNELVDDAFMWADFCEQVYRDAMGKPNTKDLDACIRAIGLKVEKTKETEISLDYLQNSCKHLLQAFLQNNFLERSVVQYICDKGKDKSFDVSQMLTEAAEIKSLLFSIVDTTKSLEASPGNYVSLLHEIEVELFMERAEKILLAHTTQQETEKWLMDYMKPIYEDQDKMELLLHVIASDFSEDSTNHKALQKIFLNSLLRRVSQKSPLFDRSAARRLWNCPSGLICKAASKHFELYKCYIDLLVTCARLMKPKEDGWVLELKDSPLGPDFTFGELVCRLKALCSTAGKTSKATKALITSLSKESAVCKEIIFHMDEQSP